MSEKYPIQAGVFPIPPEDGAMRGVGIWPLRALTPEENDYIKANPPRGEGADGYQFP